MATMILKYLNIITKPDASNLQIHVFPCKMLFKRK